MDLRTWRSRENLTLRQLAEKLGIVGRNPAAQMQRYESGQSRLEADLVERICALTGGAVTALDHQRSRLAWLRANGRCDEVPDGAAAGGVLVGPVQPVARDIDGEAA